MFKLTWNNTSFVRGMWRCKAFLDIFKWMAQDTLKLIIKSRGKNILFAYQDKHQLINYIFVLAKYYIYVNRFSGKQLNLDVFKAILRNKFQGERYTAHINNTMGKFMVKWSQMYNQSSN